MHTVVHTVHALSRQAQRNLSADDIQFVLAHGRRVHAAGALHVFLGGRDLPSDKALARRYGRLEGTVLVLHVSGDEFVLVTAYRNRRGLKAVRAKAKYDRRGTSCR
jgi:hypothetical protein